MRLIRFVGCRWIFAISLIACSLYSSHSSSVSRVVSLKQLLVAQIFLDDHARRSIDSIISQELEFAASEKVWSHRDRDESPDQTAQDKPPQLPSLFSRGCGSTFESKRRELEA